MMQNPFVRILNLPSHKQFSAFPSPVPSILRIVLVTLIYLCHSITRRLPSSIGVLIHEGNAQRAALTAALRSGSVVTGTPQSFSLVEGLYPLCTMLLSQSLPSIILWNSMKDTRADFFKGNILRWVLIYWVREAIYCVSASGEKW